MITFMDEAGKGAKFKIYSDAACTTVASKTVLETDEEGNSNTVTLPAGTYYIKETKAPTGFNLDSSVQEVTLSSSSQITGVTFTDTPVTSELNLKLDKTGAVTEEDLAGAVFRLVYYADDVSETQIDGTSDVSGDEDDAEETAYPTKEWYFVTHTDVQTGETGILNFTQDEINKATELGYASSNLYTKDGGVVFPLGTYVLYEVTPPNGYILTGGTMTYNGNTTKTVSTDSGSYLYFQLKAAGNTTEGKYETIYVNNVMTPTTQYQTINVINTEKRYGLHFEKLDYDSKSTQTQGDATNLTMSFEVYNVSGHNIWYDANQDGIRGDGETIANGQIVFSDTTAADGSYSTYPTILSYGIYQIVETGLPTGYNNAMLGGFIIDVNSSLSVDYAEGTIFSASSYFEEPVIRGGFAIEKSDSDAKNSGQYNNTDGSKLTQNSGDMTTTFTLTNLSINAVYLDMNNDGVGYSLKNEK